MTAIVVRGSALALPLPDASVDLIVTSPPYFKLRSYTDGGEHMPGQIGDEPTPAAFIDALVEATREMVRVLKPSGSIFVNLGDKYNAYNGNRGDGAIQTNGPRQAVPRGSGLDVADIPPKSLLLLPERYRIAAVDRLGLTARAVIVWSKPNGMPESVTDRVRRSHEDWVHLTKRARYFAGVDQIREPHGSSVKLGRRHNGAAFGVDKAGRGGDGTRHTDGNPLGGLPGSVWTVATQPLTVPPELEVDHYAAFPMAWPRKLIEGWCPTGICTVCEQELRPVVDSQAMVIRRSSSGRVNGYGEASRRTAASGTMLEPARRQITGYACECSTPGPVRPAVVLDPFGGTGTTALVASTLGRVGISVDLSADYCRIAQWRTTDRAQIAAAMQVPRPEPVAKAQEVLW